MRTSIALAAAGLLLIAAPAMAADRSARDTRGTAPAPAPAPIVVPVPQPAAPVFYYSNSSHGNITNNTGANTSSGNNQGSNITTGDQSNTVTVVNIGPTNNNTQVGSPAPAPAPAPTQCTGRDCPRTR